MSDPLTSQAEGRAAPDHEEKRKYPRVSPDQEYLDYVPDKLRKLGLQIEALDAKLSKPWWKRLFGR